MAKQTAASSSASTITNDRAVHLYELLVLLGRGPVRRDVLVRRLGRGLRGFYRDLEVLRKVGIELSLEDGHYSLPEEVGEVLGKLPFHAVLTLGEAQQLARGRTRAHRKLAEQIKTFEAAATARKRPRK